MTVLTLDQVYVRPQAYQRWISTVHNLVMDNEFHSIYSPDQERAEILPSGHLRLYWEVPYHTLTIECHIAPDQWTLQPEESHG